MIEDLRGEFYQNLDSKNRIIIPRRLSGRLVAENQGQIVVTRGVEFCLWIYPLATFQVMEGQVKKKMNPFDPRAQRFTNAYFSGVQEETLDKGARFVLSRHLLEYAQIKKEVVLVGSLYRIQVWSKERWEDQIRQFSVNANDIAEEMMSNFDGFWGQQTPSESEPQSDN